MRGRMIVALCLALSGPMGADAQPAARVFSSGGLGVTIEGATPNNGGGSGAGGVSVRMTITNQTSRRAYLFAVGAQNAVLSNGASLYLRNVAGITYRRADLDREAPGQKGNQESGGGPNRAEAVPERIGPLASLVRIVLAHWRPRSLAAL